MEECIVCEEELAGDNGLTCQTCKEFFISKYGGNWQGELIKFVENKNYLKHWREGENGHAMKKEEGE